MKTVKDVFNEMPAGPHKEKISEAVESGLLSWDNPYDEVTYQILKAVIKEADRTKTAEEGAREEAERQGRGAGRKIGTDPMNLDRSIDEKRVWFCNICGHAYDSYDSALRCQDSHSALMREEGPQPEPKREDRIYRAQPRPKKMGVLKKVGIGIGVLFLIIIVLGAIGSMGPAPPIDRSAELRVINADLEPTDIPIGYEAEVTVTVLNRGDLTGTTTIDVKAACIGTSVETVGQETVTLDGRKKKTLVFTFKPSKVGVWEITVEGTAVSLKLQVRMLLFAEELAEEYGANEVAADMKYKDKIFYVYGAVDDIGKDLSDNPTVSLEVSGFFNDVQCIFKKSEAKKIATLKQGDEILVRGKGEGTALGLWIYMENCELMQYGLIDKPP